MTRRRRKARRGPSKPFKLIVLLNLDLLRDFPDTLIPVIEGSIILKDKLLLSSFLSVIRNLAITYYDPNLALKYVEYQLPRLSPRKRLKLIRWLLRFIKIFEVQGEWEFTLAKVKSFLIASKVFLSAGHIYRAQHYAFSAINELREYDNVPVTWLLKADAYHILAEVFIARRFIRYSKYFSRRAINYLERWLDSLEEAGWGKYAVRIFLKTVNVTLKRLFLLYSFSSKRRRLKIKERIERVLGELGKLNFLCRYTDIDVLTDLQATLRKMEWSKEFDLEDKAMVREYRLKLDQVIRNLRLRDSFMRCYFRLEFYKSLYLMEANSAESSFRILKKLFVFSKYIMSSWNYLLFVKYNMFKILYRFDLQEDLISYLKTTDVEQYISRDEAKVPVKIKVLNFRKAIGHDGLKLAPIYSTSNWITEFRRLAKGKGNTPFNFRRSARGSAVTYVSEEG